MKDDNTGQMTGIFHDVINELISKCCGGNLTESWLNYTYQARNISECMNDDFDIVFPVLFSQVKSIEYRSRRFQELMKSPGIAVVKNRKYLERSAKWNVIQEFIQTWPVFALALILNAIFGILIWALDCRSNAEQFPQGFCRGSLQGIWWAFVTMATVGYGDKAPKFWLARVFGVVWMFVGVTVMAYLTAILTTALTSGTVTGHTMIVNKKVGVLANSQGYIEGMKQGANVKPYEDLEALSVGLYNNEVEGMLLDVFTTSYSFNKGWKENIEREDFEQVRVLDFPFVIGFFLSSEHNPYMRTCIKLISLEKYDSNDIYSTVLSYIQGSTVQETEESRSWRTNLNLFSLNEPAFRKTLHVLLIILAVLVVLGIAWELFTRQKRRTLKLSRQGHKRDVDMEVPLMRRDLKQMMNHVCEVEKYLEQILEIKQAYHRMEEYWGGQEVQTATPKIN